MQQSQQKTGRKNSWKTQGAIMHLSWHT